MKKFLSLCLLVIVSMIIIPCNVNAKAATPASEDIISSEIIVTPTGEELVLTRHKSSPSIEHALALRETKPVFYFDNIQPFSNSGPIDIAGYRAFNFSTLSEAEPLVLQMDADTISFSATAVDNAEAEVVFHMEDLNGNSYDLDIPFEADGSYYTLKRGTPKGRYYVFFSCPTSNVKIEKAFVIFSKI